MMDLKALRKSCGLTQVELAKKLGITQQQYSRYENYKMKIKLDTFLKIVEICNCKIEIVKKNESLQTKKRSV